MKPETFESGEPATPLENILLENFGTNYRDILARYYKTNDSTEAERLEIQTKLATAESFDEESFFRFIEKLPTPEPRDTEVLLESELRFFTESTLPMQGIKDTSELFATVHSLSRTIETIKNTGLGAQMVVLTALGTTFKLKPELLSDLVDAHQQPGGPMFTLAFLIALASPSAIALAVKNKVSYKREAYDGLVDKLSELHQRLHRVRTDGASSTNS
jgi:hypothetical protein